MAAARGLVVELHLLPALTGRTRRELAVLSEYAVATVPQARRPPVAAHPRRAPPALQRAARGLFPEQICWTMRA